MLRSGLSGGVRAVAGLFMIGGAVAAGQECDGVIGGGSLRPFFDRAREARVDVVAIGDSNQLFGGHGWDHGLARALSLEFSLYATGLLAAGENGGNGSGMGYTWNGFSTLATGLFSYSGAPAVLDAFLPGSTPLPPANYLYVPPGLQVGSTVSTGIFIAANSVLGVSNALRFHVIHGVLEGEGPGSFRPAIRMEQSPWSNLLVASTVPTRGESTGVWEATLDLPAAQRLFGLGFRFIPFGVNIEGPCVIYWSRVQAVERTAGASFHTLYGLGGASARRMAQGMLAATDEQLSLYFSLVRAQQDGPRSVLIRINTGLNDRNETLPSLGPAGVEDGDSPEALVDNLRAIMNRIKGIWASNNWPEEEVYFLLSTSHPVSQPDDAELVQYREAVSSLALSLPRCAATRFDRLTSADEMLSNGWYQSGGFDRNHLTQPGFETLSTRELRAMLPLRCPGDANNDGLVNFDDVTMILSRWGQCAPLAGMGDADGDRRVAFGDITMVLTFWGACQP